MSKVERALHVWFDPSIENYVTYVFTPSLPSSSPIVIGIKHMLCPLNLQYAQADIGKDTLKHMIARNKQV